MNFKLLLISFVILISLSGVANASIFQDDFSAGTFDKWTSTTGMSIVDGGSVHPGYVAHAIASGSLKHTTTEQNNYWSFDFNSTGAISTTIYYRYTDGSNGCFIRIDTASSNLVGLGNGVCGDITNTVAVPLVAGKWYNVKITDLGSSLKFMVTNISSGNNTIISTQIVADSLTYVNATPAFYFVAGTLANIDNVYISSSTSSDNTIIFDHDTYFVSDNAIIVWSLADSTWTDIFYYKSITLEWFDGVAHHDTQLISSPTQSGRYAWQMETVGTYTVKLNSRFLGIGSLAVLASDTATTQSEGQSYITANSTAFMRVPFNIAYNIGYSLAGYTSEIEIIGADATTGSTIEVLIIDATLGNTGTITAQQTGVKVWPVGRYTLKLYDVRKDRLLDTKYITIVNNPELIPVLLFNTSNITTDRIFYYINDYMTVDFIVSDSDFRNYSIRADIYNYNNSITTKQFFTPFTDQAGSFETLVNSKINMQCDRGLYCWFEPGNNVIRLVRYNATYSNVTAFYNFTVASTTLDGWGLSLSSNNITTTQELTMRVIVPPGSTGILKIRDAGSNPNATSIYRVNVNEGTQTYKTVISRVNSQGVAYYEVEIIDASNNIVKMHLPLTVNKIGVITTPQTMQTMTGSFLTSGMFPALILLMLFAGAGAMLGGIAGLMVGFGAGFIFCAIFGLIPVWALFLFAIVIITVFAIMMGKQVGGG